MAYTKYMKNYIHPSTLVGHTNYQLTCIDFKDGYRSRDDKVLVKCTCGKEKWLSKACFRSTKSCGCRRVEMGKIMAVHPSRKTNKSHGMCGTPTYSTWLNMKGRCNHDNDKRYATYGGRGISYEPRWEKFENFLEDMGERPEGTTLDRIDSSGNYSKENCRWADVETQSYNKKKRRSKSAVGTPYKGVFWYDRYEMFEGKARFKGRTVYLGRSKDDELLGMRYDKAMELAGYAEFNNKSMGVTETDLDEKYPCDFYFWSHCVKNIPQRIKLIGEN